MKKPILLSLKCIWDYAEHNALTDLIEYQGSLYCCFRESDAHAGNTDGIIRILKNDKGNWKDVALIKKRGVDLRDPKFSITPDQRLLLLMGGSIYHEGQYVTTNPHVTFSTEGEIWSPIIKIPLENEWIWRVTWQHDMGYGVAYNHAKYKKVPLTLFKTADGIHYSPVTKLRVPNHANETTLRFLNDNTMVALVRRRGNGWIGSSHPPYTDWNWSELNYRLGGPNFLVLPDGTMWASSRLFIDDEPHTAFGKMTLTSYEPTIILPSGGDTSYPGMVYKNGIIYLSYYSSHEGKAKIYLAKIGLN